MEHGNRTRNLITDSNKKQKELADILGISESMLSNYMTGRTEIPVHILVKIATYFNVSMDFLVGLTDDPEIPLRLSKFEKTFIEHFRTLTKNQRELIIANIRLMQEQNNR